MQHGLLMLRTHSGREFIARDCIHEFFDKRAHLIVLSILALGYCSGGGDNASRGRGGRVNLEAVDGVASMISAHTWSSTPSDP
jgi:hypothetical protein